VIGYGGLINIYKTRDKYFRSAFIFRYFKVFQLSQMFTCGLSDLLLVLAVGSLVAFVLREYILKVHILVSSEHKFVFHLSIFYEYQQFFQHRICCSIQPPDHSDP
jgi:hypothetical protein